MLLCLTDFKSNKKLINYTENYNFLNNDIFKLISSSFATCYNEVSHISSKFLARVVIYNHLRSNFNNYNCSKAINNISNIANIYFKMITCLDTRTFILCIIKFPRYLMENKSILNLFNYKWQAKWLINNF